VKPPGQHPAVGPGAERIDARPDVVLGAAQRRLTLAAARAVPRNTPLRPFW